jgi:hypothetical protein
MAERRVYSYWIGSCVRMSGAVGLHLRQR